MGGRHIMVSSRSHTTIRRAAHVRHHRSLPKRPGRNRRPLYPNIRFTGRLWLIYCARQYHIHTAANTIARPKPGRPLASRAYIHTTRRVHVHHHHAPNISRCRPNTPANPRRSLHMSPPLVPSCDSACVVHVACVYKHNSIRTKCMHAVSTHARISHIAIDCISGMARMSGIRLSFRM
jgi:hypothetical protein